MQVFILYRQTPVEFTVMGVYTTLALAQAAKTTKIQNYVNNQNTQRDAAYNAGLSCDAILTPSDVSDLVFITSETVK